MANMFGALNRFISRLDSDPNTTGSTSNPSPSDNSTNSHHGFQVLRNTTSSLPLDPWFDFIIGINGHNITNPSPHLFATEVQNCAGSTISLGVYGAKGQAIREVYVSVPPKEQGANLGLSLQWTPLSVAEEVYHILDVIPNSPSDVAGLLPYSDYVIGSPDGPMYGDAGLGQLVEAFIDRPLRLWVYNQEYDVTRQVTLTPARNWGGEGALGCVLGYGALHRIPAPLGEPADAPGETLFESGGGVGGDQVADGNAGAEFLVPAEMSMPAIPTSPLGNGGDAPPPPPPKAGGKARKARAHPMPAGGGGLDDYFAEGEQKSREMEGGGSTPKPSAAGLPPPPKSGPPKAASPAPPKAVEAEEKKEGGEVE